MDDNTLNRDTNLSTKEAIRKDIRNALLNKGVNRFPNLDLSVEFTDPSNDIAYDFVTRFRASGGKFIPCSKIQFAEYLIRLIQSQKYTRVLNTKPQFSNLLKANNINFSEILEDGQAADAVIVFSDNLILNPLGMVFAQRNTLYPSILGLASNIIIVAQENHIIRDLKSVFNHQCAQNNGEPYDISEIITPTPPPTTIDGHSAPTPSEPLYILILVK